MQKIGQYVGTEGSMAIAAVRGAFEPTITENVRAELEEAYRRGCTSARFDMTATTYADSTIIKLILHTLRRLGEKKLEIVNPKGLVLNAFNVACLDRFYVTAGGGRQA